MSRGYSNIKDTIIQESKKLLSNNGYKDLNIREIAKNSDIATGTFYNYFSSKDELILEIVREDWLQITDLVETLKTTNEPSKEKFRQIYLSLGTFVKNYVTFFIEITMADNYSYDYEKRPHYSRFQPMYNSISELIDIEKSKGNINSTLASYKLAQIIMSNLIYLNMNRSVSFDELYDSLKI